MTIAAAAAAMGAPEPIVQRSAEARAQASGASVDEVLAAWAGGTAAPAGSTPAPTPAEAVDQTAPELPTVDQAQVTKAPTPTTTPSPAPAAVVALGPDPDAAPLLVGRHDSPLAMVAVVLLVLLVGSLGAALAPAQGARSEVNASVGGQPALSLVALEGRAVYLREGCTSCHTMMVRSTATDADLGRVTRVQDVAPLAPDTIGARRIGPDLANIGERSGDLGALMGFLRSPATGPGVGHPPYAYLGDRDLAALAQFLVESR
jgi:hypothetical protein